VVKIKMPKQPSRNQFVTCLIGDPVEHIVSDVMFQHFAKLTGVENYNHLKFRIFKANPENLKHAMRAIPVFGIAGANITLPYKEKAIKYLNKIDKTVQLTGAVNTIVNKEGKLIGYNTDGYGAIRAIEMKMKLIKDSDKIVIFGAGGAARAIIGSFPKVFRITVLNRISNLERTKRLKVDFARHGIELEIKPITDANIILAVKEANFVINATPVGMYPKGGTSLIHKYHLDSVGKSTIKKICFFDAVFNPFETEFLNLAKQYGARTCPGIYTMIHQGIKAFKLWTGKNVSEESIEETSKFLRKVINTTYGK